MLSGIKVRTAYDAHLPYFVFDISMTAPMSLCSLYIAILVTTDIGSPSSLRNYATKNPNIVLLPVNFTGISPALIPDPCSPRPSALHSSPLALWLHPPPATCGPGRCNSSAASAQQQHAATPFAFLDLQGHSVSPRSMLIDGSVPVIRVNTKRAPGYSYMFQVVWSRGTLPLNYCSPFRLEFLDRKVQFKDIPLSPTPSELLRLRSIFASVYLLCPLVRRVFQ
ncbi:hypothetical protein T440DRAFT_207145 [Plenodomus tracheiphilus IPT5]|uniref:Uncharacterized protein n=1 Tax=Plenodomus tracheiphilus IPT5 TaxID=1408161 RepID=A0A6A7BJ45_9PLEO|nr:hypothetical protein T440DRAFT_207145 [Plenodomus tracheiphilus IPT5]